MYGSKFGYRIMPITIREETLSDEGDFIMNEIKLISQKPFSYLVYAYLQQISNSDVDTRTNYRKVYIDTYSVNDMSKKIKLSRPKITSSLKYLEQNNFLSEEVFEDFHGKYKKLYVLDCKNYVKLNFTDERICILIKCVKEMGLRLYLIYKYYCDASKTHECYLSMNQLCEWLGLSTSETNLESIRFYNKLLCKLELITIETKKLGPKKSKNIYRCI